MAYRRELGKHPFFHDGHEADPLTLSSPSGSLCLVMGISGRNSKKRDRETGEKALDACAKPRLILWPHH